MLFNNIKIAFRHIDQWYWIESRKTPHIQSVNMIREPIIPMGRQLLQQMVLRKLIATGRK